MAHLFSVQLLHKECSRSSPLKLVKYNCNDTPRTIRKHHTHWRYRLHKVAFHPMTIKPQSECITLDLVNDMLFAQQLAKNVPRTIITAENIKNSVNHLDFWTEYTMSKLIQRIIKIISHKVSKPGSWHSAGYSCLSHFCDTAYWLIAS